MTCPSCNDAVIQHQQEVAYDDETGRPTFTMVAYCPRCGYEPTVRELAQCPTKPNNQQQETAQK